MQKLATKLGTGLLMLSLLGSALAAPKMSGGKMSGSKMSMTKGKKAGKDTQVTGTVTASTPTSLTISPTQGKNGTSQTFSVPAAAKIMWGKRTISMATIKTGAKVTVYSTGGTVSSVVMHTQAMHAAAKGDKNVEDEW